MPEWERVLGDGERVELVTRKHVSVLYKPIVLFLIGFVLAALMGFLANPASGDDPIDLVAGVIFGLFLVNLSIAVLRWRAAEVVLTDRRIAVSHGIFGTEVRSVPLRDIRQVALRRGVRARLQRYGDISLDLGDRGWVRVSKIPRARSFYRTLLDVTSGTGPVPTAILEDDDTGPLPRVSL